jgi:hypothetical protein
MCVALYLLLQGRGQPGALRDIRDAAVSLHAIKKTHRKRKRGSEVIRGVRERERERKRKKERERERERERKRERERERRTSPQLL